MSGLRPVAAVIGSPVAHSLSPVLHRAGFASVGLDWSYVAFEVAEGCAAEAIAAMKVLGIGGLSVTMPHKEAVADAVDELDPAAMALRSVNTVVPMGDGRVKGYSTDGAGFVASLAEQGVSVAGLSICVLGAGGAARAIVDAVACAGARRIAVVNRTPERAASAASLAGNVGVVGDASDISGADIVVNATSVGMGDVAAVPCDVGLLHAGQVVADIVYHPRRTGLGLAAAAAGAKVIDGLGMLVHQAVEQQVLFTGMRPDAAAMWAAAEQALAARR